jgi:hypothetical protein
MTIERCVSVPPPSSSWAFVVDRLKAGVSVGSHDLPRAFVDILLWAGADALFETSSAGPAGEDVRAPARTSTRPPAQQASEHAVCRADQASRMRSASDEWSPLGYAAR